MNVRLLFTGMLISFLGTLPLGVLNVTALQLSIEYGLLSAFSFSLGALVVEMIYVRLSLLTIDWFLKKEGFFKWLQLTSIGILLILAVTTFLSAESSQTSVSSSIIHSISPFLAGLLLSAINPAQIPFWFGWSSILFSKGALERKSSAYNSYIGGIGVGTFFGNAVFILGGLLLSERLTTAKTIINYCISAAFAIAALVQIIQLIKKGRSVK